MAKNFKYALETRIVVRMWMSDFITLEAPPAQQIRQWKQWTVQSRQKMTFDQMVEAERKVITYIIAQENSHITYILQLCCIEVPSIFTFLQRLRLLSEKLCQFAKEGGLLTQLWKLPCSQKQCEISEKRERALFISTAHMI